MIFNTLDKKEFEIVELLRFFAAFAVMCVHIPSIGYGHLGVDLFFIISGFVMMYSTEHNHSNFFLKRIIRIVPLYWTATFVLFIFALFFPSFLLTTSANFIHLIKSLFFIPFEKGGEHAPILTLGWTLNLEMYFYLLFAISLTINKNLRGVICSFLIFILFIYFHSSDSFYKIAYGNSIVLEFILGILAYQLIIKKEFISLENLFYLTLIIMPAILKLLSFPMISDLLLNKFSARVYSEGLPLFVLFIGLLWMFREIKIGNIFILLGGASYSLYLLHVYIIFFIQRVLIDQFNIFSMNMAVIIFIMIVCVLMSILSYLLFEKPITKYLRNKLSS